MKQKTYYISGMHCSSCELIIEKKILEEKGVHSVDASLSNKQVTVMYEDHAPGVHKLNEWFKKDGYTFTETPPKKEKGSAAPRKNGRTIVNILIIVGVLILIERLGIANYVSVNERSSIFLFFLFGLVAGLSSCAALVGGLLLSLSKNWDGMRPHAYFHIGRILAYAIIGGVLGGIGKFIGGDHVVFYSLLTLVVSVLMGLIGLQMAGVSWAQKIQIRMPKFITRKVSMSSEHSQKHVPFAIGAGTILLPCGFTLVAEGIALTSGSILQGALMLLFFVLGTMIPLLFIGFIGTKHSFSFYTGVVLVLFALYNVNAQLNVLGLPSVNDVLTQEKNFETKQLSEPVPAPSSEKQVVTLYASNFNYEFTSDAVLRAGRPTTLIVTDGGIRGCGRFLAARGLIKGYVQLKPGDNRIDLGRPKAGTYKITCSMGMVPPVTLVVK